jgi:subtilisin family serine protease
MKRLFFLLPIVIFSNILSGQNSKERYLLEVSEGFNDCILNELGIQYQTQIGRIYTLALNQREYTQLKNNNAVDRIRKANHITPLIKRTQVDINTDSIYKAIDLETGYSGKDVIIGITDWGFNYNHPNFYDTGLVKNRVIGAWDQFKTSGPSPTLYNYGTEYYGESEILAAEKDTYNIYEWATHGTHVAGIAGGGGAGIGLKGVAFEAEFLMVTFLANEAAVIDGIEWMRQKAEQENKRLVVNMSWGLYNLQSIDGTSLLSDALNELSKKGVILVTSGGNNGDVNFHIKKEFNNDTMRSEVDFYPFSAHPKMYGQRVSLWGSSNPFNLQLEIRDKSLNLLHTGITYQSQAITNQAKKEWINGSDTVTYQVISQKISGKDNRQNLHAILQEKQNKYRIIIKVWAEQGTIHCFNVVELTNGVGNWGMPFMASEPGWLAGDNEYGLGEPASTESVITVAAHSPRVVFNNGHIIYGSIAPFSSSGPTIDGRKKPDISAPGVSVESSISAYTTRSYDQTKLVTYNGLDYPFARYSGTSMSSPAVAGVVALMLQANPSLSSQQVKNILKSTAFYDDKTGILKDSHSVQYGWGKVNAYAAVKMAEDSRPIAPILKTKPSFELFPNPATNKLYFMGELDSTYICSIYNSSGKMIFSGEFGGFQSMDISLLKNGIYFVKIEGIEDVKKLIVF